MQSVAAARLSTVNVAMLPMSIALPSEVVPIAKDTDPVGVPYVALTVATIVKVVVVDPLLGEMLLILIEGVACFTENVAACDVSVEAVAPAGVKVAVAL